MKKKALQLKLPRLLQEGMVLQRGKPVTLWGEGLPGSRVEINFQGSKRETVVGKDSRWQLLTDTLQTGGPFPMEIRSRECRISLERVYVGDVWLCLGQSNMELPISRVKDAYPYVFQNCHNPYIRLFHVKEHFNFHGPEQELESGEWLEADSDTLAGFSAFSYFFAKYVNSESKIPIGIINVSKGGSPIEAWLSNASVADRPVLGKTLALFRDDRYAAEFIEKNERQQSDWQKLLKARDAGLASVPWYQDWHDEGWEPMELPGWFSGDRLHNFSGVIWLRKRFDVPSQMAGKPADLWLGTITDSDEAYVNGCLVGETGYQYPPRKYKVPEGILKEYGNVLTIRVLCERGGGRLTPGKEYCLFSQEGRVDLRGTAERKWEYRIGCRCSPAPMMDFIIRKPTGLFNGMLAPCMNMTIKGVVWYQGESNDKNPEEYEEYLRRLVTSWREGWGEKMLPFILVQLPSFAIDLPEQNSGWPEIREAQRKISHELEKVKLTVNLDLGEWNDLHPLRKKEAGERAAAAALEFDAGDGKTEQGPVPAGIRKEEGRVIVTFEPAEKLLVQGGRLEAAELAGENGIFYKVQAWTEENRMIVECPAHMDAKEFRYAWSNAPEGGLLCNLRGYPASPFRMRIG